MFETWLLTLREEHRPRVSENRVMRRVFRPRRDEVTGGRRKLYNEKLRNLYSSPSIIRMIEEDEMGRAVARMGKKRIGGKETTMENKK
jgi:hypothetical protein